MKYYNNTYRYLLPLYDFDYEISNDQINYIGVFKYCPYYPSHEGIYVVYELKKNEEVTNLPHCITTEKITKRNKNYLVCLLSPPKNYLIDWPSLTKCDFVNVSWDCKYKIINSKINKNIKDFIVEPLCNYSNYSFSQTSKNILTNFNSSDILNW